MSNTKSRGCGCYKTVGIAGTAAHCRQCRLRRRVLSSLLPEWIGKKKDTLLDFVREGREKGGQGSESPSEMAENKGIDVRKLQKSVLTVHTNPGKMTGGH